ncbi:YppG family protein [Metabacillus sp. GX 13764]|uniref:YppG family protein n=1 Tax=Metabacillus kandeliae TaxID=2900151 RepID=UPI001E3BF3E0|nr:YppG family protein [Metabacillus kandeliae]MCD7033980.1 YppG family protein [Metabacillus kandeliae]
MNRYYHHGVPPFTNGHSFHPVHNPVQHHPFYAQPYHPHYFPGYQSPGSPGRLPRKQKSFLDAYKTPTGSIDYSQVSLTMSKMNKTLYQFNPLLKQFLSLVKK